jgi:hypothetical protein
LSVSRSGSGRLGVLEPTGVFSLTLEVEIMADQPDIKRLELRIQELENQLKHFQAAAVPQDISKDEIAAFHKVSAALASFDDWGGGINDRPIFVCRVCRVCQVCRVCRICINECVCGPCNICSSGGQGGGFSGFGS